MSCDLDTSSSHMIWEDASIWPEPEIDLLLMVNGEFTLGYWDYAIYRNDKHEPIQPTCYVVLIKPKKVACRCCNGTGSHYVSEEDEDESF